jgi:hypothetical protein
MAQDWVRLDNASNIFLAARTDVDTKVFRLVAEVDHEVDRTLLQRALDVTFDRYPLYHAVLRRGLFWYYLQDSDLRPRVTGDVQYPCAPIYRPDHRSLLFRVMAHDRRIVLEVFHALSDGTGGLWFLSDLVTAYLRAHDGEGIGADTDAPDVDRHLPTADPARGLTVDSFADHFRRRGHGHSSREREPAGPVHRVTGTKTPDHRPRLVELTLPTRGVLDLAHDAGVSMTMFLTAVFLCSVRATAPHPDRARTLSASVPVNLRQFFDSTSARNFFATVRVEHTFASGDDPRSVAGSLEAGFRHSVSPDRLEDKVRRFVRLERSPMTRVVPRPLKDLLLSLLNRADSRGLTVAVSNLGKVRLDQDVDARVSRIFLQVSAARPQFCAVSHGDALTVSFTSPFTDTSHVREFARFFTGRGLDVLVAAGRVTEAELGEAAT